MDPENGSKGKTGPGSSDYRPENVHNQIMDAVGAFENDLNRHLTEWIKLCDRLIASRLVFGSIAFPVIASLSLAALFHFDRDPAWAFGMAASPLLFLLWTLIREDRAESRGRGVEGSEGLTPSCMELKRILELAHRDLVGEREASVQKLRHRTGHGAVEGIAELSGLRMKCLLFNEKARGGAGMLTSICDGMLKRARTQAAAIPGALLLLAAGFAAPFIILGVPFPWEIAQPGIAAALIITALIASFTPLFFACRFVETVKRRLVQALEENWEIALPAFDRTGDVTTEVQKLIEEREQFDRLVKELKRRGRALAEP